METEPIFENHSVSSNLALLDVACDGEFGTRHVVRTISRLGTRFIRTLSVSYGKRCLGTYFIEPIHHWGSDPFFYRFCDDLALRRYSRVAIGLLDYRMLIFDGPSLNLADPEWDSNKYPRVARSSMDQRMVSSDGRRAFGWVLRLPGRRHFPMEELESPMDCFRCSQHPSATLGGNSDHQS